MRSAESALLFARPYLAPLPNSESLSRGGKKMPRRSQLRLIFHGAIFMLVTMIVGFFEFFLLSLPHAFDEPVRQSLRQWHAILMTTGIWMIATGAGLPLLELTSRGISWLVWMLVISGYTFILSLIVLGLGF